MGNLQESRGHTHTYVHTRTHATRRGFTMRTPRVEFHSNLTCKRQEINAPAETTFADKIGGGAQSLRLHRHQRAKFSLELSGFVECIVSSVLQQTRRAMCHSTPRQPHDVCVCVCVCVCRDVSFWNAHIAKSLELLNCALCLQGRVQGSVPWGRGGGGGGFQLLKINTQREQ